jgi:hypothetical protein
MIRRLDVVPITAIQDQDKRDKRRCMQLFFKKLEIDHFLGLFRVNTYTGVIIPLAVLIARSHTAFIPGFRSGDRFT